MKTLVVLAALAAVAVAVPAERYNYGSTSYGLPTQRREKKSSESLPSDVLKSSSIPELDTTHEVEARTFKKPILIKKTLPYYPSTYRDSDKEKEVASENAQEKCKQEVIMKDCDSKTIHQRSADDTAAAGPVRDNVQDNIKMAKEAIENLQKATQSQKVETGLEAELHENIAFARQTLDHIQKNFGNLESMNLHARTLSEAEVLKDEGARLETESRDHWKEHIENTQRISDVPKNIEDSVKLVSSGVENVAKGSASTIASMANLAIPKNLFGKNNEDNAFKSDELVMKKDAEEIHEMMPAASEVKETKLTLEDIPVKAKHSSLKFEDVVDEKQIEGDDLKQSKNSEIDMPRFSTLKDASADHEEVLKEKLLKNSENAENLVPASPMPVMRMVPAHNSNQQQARGWSDKTEKSSLNENELSGLIKPNQDILPIPRMEHAKTAVIDTTMLMKSDEHNQRPLPRENTMQAKDVEHPQPDLALTSTSGQQKSVLKVRVPEEKNMQQQAEVEMPQKSSNIENHHELSSFKSADHQTLNSDGQNPEAKNIHLDVPVIRVAESNNMNQRSPQSSEQLLANGDISHFSEIAPKAAVAFKDAEFPRSHMNPSFVHPEHMHQMHPHHMPHHHQLHPHTMHSKPMHVHFKSADMDSAIAPSSQVNIIDPTAKAAMDHGSMLNWKQKESARGAYGLAPYGVGAAAAAAAASAAASASAIGAGAGAGAAPAVGVFPGASVGGCAIPLLLSCSPSVVPGTLAKTSSYAAPHAYRSTNTFDSRFQSKRDIKQVKEITKKIKRTPAKFQTIPVDKKL